MFFGAVHTADTFRRCFGGIRVHDEVFDVRKLGVNVVNVTFRTKSAFRKLAGCFITVEDERLLACLALTLAGALIAKHICRTVVLVAFGALIMILLASCGCRRCPGRDATATATAAWSMRSARGNCLLKTK